MTFGLDASRAALALAVLVALLAGCDNPSEGKPRAAVSSPSSPAAIAAGSVSWPISAQDSRIAFVGAKVTGKHDGTFQKFSGNVQMTGTNVESALLKVDIETASITSDNDKLTGHLKSADFFDVGKFPSATFISTSIKPGAGPGVYTIAGNLTMKGITKGVTFPATVQLSGDVLDAKAEFAINRKEWNIVFPGMPDDLIKDDVVLKLTIRSTRPKS